MNKILEKRDAVMSLIVGALTGFFALMVFKLLESDIDLPISGFWYWLFPVGLSLLSLIGIFFASWIGKRFVAIYQIAKFGLVGALNTLVDLGVLSLLIFRTGIATGLFYILFKAISFMVAAVNSYFWNKHWTFEKRDEEFETGEFFKFLSVTVFGFLINVGVASFVVIVIGPKYQISDELWANIAAIIATLFAFIWNFVGSKFIVFKK